MTTARRLITNLSKGELAPEMEGRPDLASYFEGASLLENWTILKTGGVTRRVGTRFIAEVKNSLKDTILWPFEASVNDAAIIEMGDGYARFFKDKAPIGAPYEITSPYSEARLRQVHFTQSVDVMFTFHIDVPQQRLSRVSDTNWAFSSIVFQPPPSFEADSDTPVYSGAYLTPGATTGSSVPFHASTGTFLNSDVGRQIVSGSSRASVIAITDSQNVTCRILDAFPSILPIPPTQWFFRLSPQTTLDPDIRAPVGATVTLTAGTDMFWGHYVGRYISIYGGVVQITVVVSTTVALGILLSEMSGTSLTDPAAAPAGSWTLEVPSWSPTNGYTRTGEFFQGKLAQAATRAQPTTWWLSAPDDYDNYVLGVTADSAIEYTMATKGLNQIEWMTDVGQLFLGTSGSEHVAKPGKDGAPIGGDNIPLVERVGTQGNAPMQPVVIGRRVLSIDRSRRLSMLMAFNWESDGFEPNDLTGAASHITESEIRQHPPAVQRRLFPLLFWIRNDGQLVTLTFNEKEKVIGFTRYVTDGTFESIAVIPKATGPDEIWVIVKRTINGIVKRYVEVLEEDNPNLADRAWSSLQTDCAKTYLLAGTTTTLAGLNHLEGKTVDVIADGNYIGQQTVVSGMITLIQPASHHVEVGLHYASRGATMRPAVDGMMIEGLPRSWNEMFIRVMNTKGGRLQGEDLRYPAQMPPQTLFTGELIMQPMPGGTTDERIAFEQHLPYPMTVLALYGDLTIGT